MITGDCVFEMHFNVKRTKSIARSYNNILTFLEVADSIILVWHKNRLIDLSIKIHTFLYNEETLICDNNYTSWWLQVRTLWNLVLAIARYINTHTHGWNKIFLKIVWVGKRSKYTIFRPRSVLKSLCSQNWQFFFPVWTSWPANNTYACSFTSIPYSINCELTLNKERQRHS